MPYSAKITAYASMALTGVLVLVVVILAVKLNRVQARLDAITASSDSIAGLEFNGKVLRVPSLFVGNENSSIFITPNTITGSSDGKDGFSLTNGIPSTFSLSDEHGTTRISMGPIGLINSRTGTKTEAGPSTIVMFDSNGTVLRQLP